MKKEILVKDNRPKSELEVLREVLPQYFDKNGKFLFEKFKTLFEENKEDISKESYGLEWLGKSYARVLATEPTRTLLKEDKDWNSKEGNKNSKNLLIKGDNLEVLKHLINAYYGKIKMIYIDPPYNTGNDGFIYQDNRRFTPQELSELAGISIDKAKRILDFVDSKSSSHSAWLTFMYPRLYVARQLLRDDGVIFISIDDNEVAQLRILMDEIFGEENFVAQLIWVKGAGSNSERIRVEHEYIVLYAKDKSKVKLNGRVKEDSRYPFKDERGYYKLENLYRGKPKSKGTVYPIECNGIKVYPESGNPNLGRWAWTEENFLWAKENDLIVIEENNNPKTRHIRPYTIKYKVYKNYELDIKNKRLTKVDGRQIPYSNIIKISGKQGSNTLEKLFLIRGIFNNPKPVSLIEYLLKIATNNSDIILDFFAGSGTTGDAVMQLNVEDGGSRKFILVQLPEPIDPKKNKAAYNFVKTELGVEDPTIFEITKERLTRAAKKIIKDKEKEISEIKKKINQINSKSEKTEEDIKKLNKLQEKLKTLKKEFSRIKQMDLGFKVFETVDLPNEYFNEPEELTEDLNLFDGYRENDIDALLTTWKVFDGIPLEVELEVINLEINNENNFSYKIYYYDGKLYLMHKEFNTNILAKILEKIDQDKDFNPSKIIINGYNFDSKTQREIDETVKNYSNKKSLNIDIIVRY